MNQVVITGISPIDAIGLKHELDNMELILNKDYTWRYHLVKYDSLSLDEISEKHVVFEFTDPAMASFFQLKWTK